MGQEEENAQRCEGWATRQFQLDGSTENRLFLRRALRLREAIRQQQSRADREHEDAPHDHFSARPDFAGFGSKLAFNKLATLSLNFVIHFPN